MCRMRGNVQESEIPLNHDTGASFRLGLRIGLILKLRVRVRLGPESGLSELSIPPHARTHSVGDIEPLRRGTHKAKVGGVGSVWCQDSV